MKAKLFKTAKIYAEDKFVELGRFNEVTGDYLVRRAFESNWFWINWRKLSDFCL